MLLIQLLTNDSEGTFSSGSHSSDQGLRWKRLYSQRMSIERRFHSLKHSRELEGHFVRGLKKIRLLCAMSMLTYQTTALARLKAGDVKRMRSMMVMLWEEP